MNSVNRFSNVTKEYFCRSIFKIIYLETDKFYSEENGVKQNNVAYSNQMYYTFQSFVFALDVTKSLNSDFIPEAISDFLNETDLRLLQPGYQDIWSRQNKKYDIFLNRLFFENDILIEIDDSTISKWSKRYRDAANFVIEQIPLFLENISQMREHSMHGRFRRIEETIRDWGRHLRRCVFEEDKDGQKVLILENKSKNEIREMIGEYSFLDLKAMPQPSKMFKKIFDRTKENDLELEF